VFPCEEVREIEVKLLSMRPSNKDLFELDEARMRLATKIHRCFAVKDAIPYARSRLLGAIRP
jgi:hypothetical protein